MLQWCDLFYSFSCLVSVRNAVTSLWSSLGSLVVNPVCNVPETWVKVSLRFAHSVNVQNRRTLTLCNSKIYNLEAKMPWIERAKNVRDKSIWPASRGNTYWNLSYCLVCQLLHDFVIRSSTYCTYSSSVSAMLNRWRSRSTVAWPPVKQGMLDPTG